MKKLLVVLAILFIGILLAGCTTSQPAAPVATPAPTPVPTVVQPAPTPVPTKVVVVVVENKTANVTATPTATPAPVPSQTITFTSTMTILPSVSVTIPKGGKVIWKNDDPFKPHGVQAIDNQLAQKYFGGINPIQIPYGKTFEVTFNDVGAFDYTTVFQPQTVGRIVVTK